MKTNLSNIVVSSTINLVFLNHSIPTKNTSTCSHFLFKHFLGSLIGSLDPLLRLPPDLLPTVRGLRLPRLQRRHRQLQGLPERQGRVEREGLAHRAERKINCQSLKIEIEHKEIAVCAV